MKWKRTKKAVQEAKQGKVGDKKGKDCDENNEDDDIKLEADDLSSSKDMEEDEGDDGEDIDVGEEAELVQFPLPGAGADPLRLLPPGFQPRFPVPPTQIQNLLLESKPFLTKTSVDGLQGQVRPAMGGQSPLGRGAFSVGQGAGHGVGQAVFPGRPGIYRPFVSS